MRVAVILLVGAWFASTAWARVGENAEEAAERYGPPRESYAGAYSGTVTRVYTKDGVRVEASYFENNLKKTVIGEIKYSLPAEMSQSNVVATAVLLQLLEANAAGQPWEMHTNRPVTQEYHRPGATALMTLTLLTVTLEEYAALVTKAKNEIVTDQADRIDKNLKDF